jgi:ubiquinone/menaquinone biosynthesis C-methylase UbiE
MFVLVQNVNVKRGVWLCAARVALSNGYHIAAKDGIDRSHGQTVAQNAVLSVFKASSQLSRKSTRTQNISKFSAVLLARAGKCHCLYFCHLLPKIGGLVSGEKEAYRYLPASVHGFPPEGEFRRMMEAAGFRDVTGKAMTFGLCRMFTGEK